jgi:ATP-binding cassette subfamily F protein 3
LRSRGNEPRASEAERANRSSATPVEAESPARRAARKKAAKIESELATLQQECGAIEQQLADPALYAGNSEEAVTLARRQAELKARHEALETEWLQLYESLQQ